ncbi:Retrotransposon Copia-like, N-terminal [Dillenia turbinata]|uniref:Retrotransposon Copia-like, N-terminal n=1 Tax=Dillenia turbinata TaxID=194707 RepID=A0AAN8UJ44_9MAGN
MLSQILAPPSHEPVVAPIGIKLDDTNYGLWSQVVEMYISGKDKLGYINGNLPQPSEVYDLKRKVTRLKQNGGPIKTYYNTLQGLWREIYLRRPNPMKLDDRLDKIRADVLQLQPFPTLEQAYAYDVLTKEIIDRGTKRGRLYYMDDLRIGQANNIGRNNDKEREI